MDSPPCPWCRAGHGLMKDEDIIKEFDEALAIPDRPRFDDAIDQLNHSGYHRCYPRLQHADADVAVSTASLKLLEWLVRTGGVIGTVVPTSDDVRQQQQATVEVGETIVGFFYSQLHGFVVKGNRVQGTINGIEQKNAVRKSFEISFDAPHGRGDSKRTVGETISDNRPLPGENSEDVFEARDSKWMSQYSPKGVSALDKVIADTEVGVLRETLKEFASYARICLGNSRIPLFLSAGIQIRNKAGKWGQMNHCRLGGWLAQLHGGKPIRDFGMITSQMPSLKVMQWQVLPDVYAHFQALPEWVMLRRDTLYQRVKRGIDVLIAQNLLLVVRLETEGDGYDVVNMS